jgi:rhodanese-related sulfurtransferase
MSGPPEERTTVAELIAAARARLDRLSPLNAHAAMEYGALLIDIRSDSQRDRDGIVPGAHVVARNVLEWRLDPASPHRDPQLARPESHIVLLCDEGYQSSLVAATLQRFGLLHATDVIGGFQAWRAAGLPVETAADALDPGRSRAADLDQVRSPDEGRGRRG